MLGASTQVLLPNRNGSSSDQSIMGIAARENRRSRGPLLDQKITVYKPAYIHLSRMATSAYQVIKIYKGTRTNLLRTEWTAYLVTIVKKDIVVDQEMIKFVASYMERIAPMVPPIG